MMDYLLIAIAAFTASALTFFSGFGLGTILMPVFALFFPVHTAVALTAVVHFLNNIFKLGLTGFFADKAVILRFGIPAIVAAFAGAELLTWMSASEPVASYYLGHTIFYIRWEKIIMAFVMIIFALLEIIPTWSQIHFDPKYLLYGGILSGFFGGLSGHQGALRSAFLLRLGLSKESFIATGVVIACMIDITRLGVYGLTVFNENIVAHWPPLLTAISCAFGGAFLGNRFLKKMTIALLQKSVALFLIALACALATGII